MLLVSVLACAVAIWILERANARTPDKFFLELPIAWIGGELFLFLYLIGM